VPGQFIEVGRRVEAGKNRGAAAADPVRQDKCPARVDERGRVQHHRITARGHQVGQDVRGDRREARLGVLNRLERTRGTRCVKHQHRVAGAGRHARIRIRRLSHLRQQVNCVYLRRRPQAGQPQPVHPGSQLTSPAGQVRTVHQQPHPGGGEHAGLLIRGQPDIQRHPRGTGLQAAEVHRDRPDPVADQQTHPRTAGHAKPGQHMRDPVRRRIHLTERQRPIPADHRRPPRMPRRAAAHQFHRQHRVPSPSTQARQPAHPHQQAPARWPSCQSRAAEAAAMILSLNPPGKLSGHLLRGAGVRNLILGLVAGVIVLPLTFLRLVPVLRGSCWQWPATA
jgi:hypothetical protein